MARSVLIMGAGLIGTTTAWYLAQHGFDVTVVERRAQPGLETSFANGGMIHASEADPWNAPGTVRRLLGWLGHEDAPLLVRARALPGMTRWGLAFLRASRPARFEAAARANLRLALYSVQQLKTLRAALDLRYEAKQVGTMKIFRSADALAQDSQLAATLAHHGLDYRVLSATAASTHEPALQAIADELAGAIHYPADESGDAFLFTQTLAEHARHAGVRFVFNTSIKRVHRQGKQVAALTTADGQTLQADNYVLAAGAYSARLARQCGLRVPIYPAKGYSLTVPIHNNRAMPATPIVDFQRKIYITPYQNRLRIAGTAEFAGYDTTLTRSRCHNLLTQAQHVLPRLLADVHVENTRQWAGLRPLSADGSPIIGATALQNLYINSGHGPLGWTLAAGSGRVLADIIAERTPAIATHDLSPARFGGKH